MDSFFESTDRTMELNCSVLDVIVAGKEAACDLICGRLGSSLVQLLDRPGHYCFIELTYPMKVPYRKKYQFPRGEGPIPVGDLCWAICRMYEDLYRRIKKGHNPHFVYGHWIGDLRIEGARWIASKGVIRPIMGS